MGGTVLRTRLPYPGRGTVLCATGRIACATRQSENAPSGRGTVLRACQFCGPRGRGPSHSTIREGHGPLCHRQDCLCHAAERERTLWEGRSPLCPLILADRGDAVPPIPPLGRGAVLCATGRIACATQQSENAPSGSARLPNPGRGAVLCARKSLPPCLPILRTARTRSLPFHHSGGPQSPVPQAGLPVPLSGAKTYPLGGARSSVAANPCLCARQFLRTARTRSLPMHHSGGAQSPVPVNSCGPRGRGPSHCTIREGHGPLCHRQDCLCHCAERKRTL
jgi:hypothetical protein